MRVANRIRCQSVNEKCFLITIVARDRSSLEELELANLGDELRAITFATKHPHVILDLGPPARYGARLLGILARLASALRDNGRQLAVCGDHQDLLGISGLARVIATHPTLAEALNVNRRDRAGLT
jgi:hypothetical protein